VAREARSLEIVRENEHLIYLREVREGLTDREEIEATEKVIKILERME
jgi:hypothetical protein